MFEAFVIVCAASLSGVDYNTCIKMSDSWGPYRTEENCNIRTDQIIEETIDGPFRQTFIVLLNQPDMLYAEGFCTRLEGSEA